MADRPSPPPADDPLGVAPYVAALADHVLDRRAQAPFAIGVFGGWGAGKSHLLRQLEGQLRARTEGAPRSADWHNNVVYVHFNAWHYAEADLWASLIGRLFEALAEHRLGISAAEAPAAVAAERERLLSQISVAQTEAAEAEAAVQAAEGRVAAAAAALAEKRAQIDRSSTGLRLIAASSVGAMTEVLRRSLAQTQPQRLGPDGQPIPGYDWRAGKPAAPPVPEAWSAMTERLRGVAAEVELLNATRALLGQPELRDGADARATLAVLQGGLARGRALMRALLSQELRVEKIALLTMVMLMPFMAVWVIGQLAPSGATMGGWMAALQTWGKAGAGVLGMIGTAFTFWQSAITPRLAQLDKYAAALPTAARAAEAAVDGLTELSARIDEIIEERRALLAGRAAEEQAALQAAEAEAEALSAQLQASRAARAADQAALEALRAGSRLDRFLADTRAGGAYAARLGFLTTIRRDLDRLEALLGALRDEASDPASGQASHEAGDENRRPHVNPSEETAAPGPTPGAPAGAELRVVLSIDDLDRCPPERVVEVLQAIHLLLATPLFVVLVAVDPAWLLGSIRAHSRRLLAPDDPTGTSPGGGALDPQRYLEKIIQIPFQVPPMRPAGFAALAARGLGRGAPGTPPDLGPAAPSAGPARAEISDEELAFFLGLAPLVSSPRAADRLVEVYRLARGLLPAAPEPAAALQAQQALALCLALGFDQPGALRRLQEQLAAQPAAPAVGLAGCLHAGAGPEARAFAAALRVPASALAAAWPIAARFSYSPEDGA